MYPTELGKAPDDIEFVGKITYLFKKDKYYVFKYRSDSDTLSDNLKNKWLILALALFLVITAAACSGVVISIDGVPAEDWAWLAKQESYRLPPVDFAEGFVGVYNPDALWRDVTEFCRKRHYFGAALHEELLCAGLHVGAQVSLADVPAFECGKCLLVTDLNAYTDEQKQMLASAKLPILAVGEDVDLPVENSTRYGGKYISVALYNAPQTPDFAPLAALERVLRKMPAQHGEIWTEPLSHRRVRPDFFRALAEILNTAFDLDRAAPDVKIASYRCAGEKYVMLSNDRHTYYLPTVITAAPVTGATALLKDKGYQVKCKENTFTVRIPPRGVEIVKVEE